MAKNRLNKELEKQDKEELVRLLGEMARRFPIAKMYLTMEFGFESAGIIEKYKKEIEKEYFPSRGHGKARSSRVNKVLKEFTQIAAFKEDILEMQWFQIELAVKFYLTYGYDHDPFLNSLLKNWEKFIKGVLLENIISQYEERIHQIIDGKSHRYWLFEQLKDIYENPEIDEEELSDVH